MFAALIFAVAMLAQPAPAAAQPAHRVQRIATPIDDVALGHVLRDAHVVVFGRAPSQRRLSVAFAQVRAEGSRAGWCYNLGSIGAGPRGPYFRVGGARFAAAASFEEGAQRYWRTLRDHYSGALRAFDDGDADAAAKRLGRAGYHRTDPDAYARAMRSIAWEYWRDIAPHMGAE